VTRVAFGNSALKPEEAMAWLHETSYARALEASVWRDRHAVVVALVLLVTLWAQAC
jgi:hypothetical protein